MSSPETAMLPPQAQADLPTGPSLRVATEAGPGGVVGVTITNDDVERLQANLRMAADGARVQRRLYSGEFQFAQVHALDSSRLSRLVVVRMAMPRFEEGLKTTRPVLENVGPIFALPGEMPDGRAVAVFQKIEHFDAPTTLVDADFVFSSFTGNQASLLFVSMSTADRRALSNNRPGSVILTAEVEISLPTASLVDLVGSWGAAVPAAFP